MKEIFRLSGVDCAACAAKAERRMQKVKGVRNLTYGFLTEKLTVEYDGDRDTILAELLTICKKIDKNTTIRPY